MTKSQLGILKSKLQTGDPKKLELLAADILTRLIDVRFSVAKAGFQHGSDAATIGRDGRHLRLECKRYGDDSSLNDRELKGEIDDALQRDHLLEAWILVATRAVSQQTADGLHQKSLAQGVPVIVIDWPDDTAHIPPLAALCGFAPDVVRAHYGRAAEKAAESLTTVALPVTQRLARELEPWSIGFDTLRRRAHERFEKLWRDRVESRSLLNQDIAAGLVPTIPRHAVDGGLSTWWSSSPSSSAVVHGDEGMGKTWAAVQWMRKRLDGLPVSIILPASAFKRLNGITLTSVHEFLGDELHELAPGPDRSFWRNRVHRLLERPDVEGPAFFLLIDGVNQEPSFEWVRFLQILEAKAFSGKVRVLVTAQTHFLREQLRDLRRLSNLGTRLEIGSYDLSPGGEFDQLLQLHGLARDGLSSGVIALARVPRLFALTMQQKAEEAFQGAPTPSRLLWAHARDELGQKAHPGLSERAWEIWLHELATRYLSEIAAGHGGTDSRGYSESELGDMVRDPAGSADVTARRLQEIVSGAWLEPVPGMVGRYRPTEATIHLALGVAVVGALEQAEVAGTDEAQEALARFLDPVRATSIAADILCSALSIVVGRSSAETSVGPRLILSALLQSQNATDDQRESAVQLAPSLVDPLLFVVENSGSRAAASARYWALAALRSVPALNQAVWRAIVDRAVVWVCHVNAPPPDKLVAEEGNALRQAEMLRQAIGTDTLGVRRVLGAPLRLHDAEPGNLADHVPELLLGKPLVPFMKVFVAAAVASAVGHAGKPWTGLKWLVMFNRADPDALRAELALLSEVAMTVEREPGVNARLARQVSNLLLWLTADEALEKSASRAYVGSSHEFSYGGDYLKDPVKSIFELEHRHVDAVLASTEITAFQKLRRIQDFLPDPTLRLSPGLSQEIDEWGSALNVEEMSSGRNYSMGDRNLEQFVELTSRVSPEAIGRVIDRWFETFATRQGERRHWSGNKVPEFSLLVSPAHAAAIRAMRLRRPATPHTDARAGHMHMLQGEVLHEDVDSQLDALVNEPLAFISIQLAEALRPPGPDTVESFVHRWGLENSRALEVLCNYLCMNATPLSAKVFEWLLRYALTPRTEHQVIVFMALSRCNPADFGRELLRNGWRAVPSDDDFVQDSGSTAVLVASKTRPLEELAKIVAPWCVLEEAMRRGAKAVDLDVAACTIDRTLMWDGSNVFPTTTDISVTSIGPRHYVAFAIADRPPSPEEMFRAFDPDARWAQFEAASKVGEEYLRDTRAAGAVLAIHVVDVDAARALVRHCRSTVDRWLDGVDLETPQAIARLNAAGGLFVAICEALFEVDAAQAEMLWRVLRRRLRIRFKGVGDINELVLLVFRIPASTEALALRRELFSLLEVEDDASYLDLALAAISQGAGAWLDSEIAADEVSMEPFRQRRAIVLRSFQPPELSYASVWEEGECHGTWDALRRRTRQSINRASQARYWWRAFLTAGDPLSAFCAWQLFVSRADKMAWVWLESDLETFRSSDELWRLKMLHFRYNSSAMTTAMKEKIKRGSKSLEGNLVNWDMPRTWFSTASLAELDY